MRILVVEDDPLQREVMRRELAAVGVGAPVRTRHGADEATILVLEGAACWR